MSPLAKGRLKMGLVAFLFLAPMAAAWTLYLNPEWRPAGRLNYGQLIEPPRAVPVFSLTGPDGPAPGALRGKWTLVYVGGARCEAACEQRLLLSRQVRALLNQDRGRVQRVYIAPDAAARDAARAQLGTGQADLVIVADTGVPGARAAEFFAQAGRDPDALYLLDPPGVWLMRYSGELDYKRVLKDLKKLLRFSTVG